MKDPLNMASKGRKLDIKSVKIPLNNKAQEFIPLEKSLSSTSSSTSLSSTPSTPSKTSPFQLEDKIEAQKEMQTKINEEHTVQSLTINDSLHLIIPPYQPSNPDDWINQPNALFTLTPSTRNVRSPDFAPSPSHQPLSPSIRHRRSSTSPTAIQTMTINAVATATQTSNQLDPPHFNPSDDLTAARNIALDYIMSQITMPFLRLKRGAKSCIFTIRAYSKKNEADLNRELTKDFTPIIFILEPVFVALKKDGTIASVYENTNVNDITIRLEVKTRVFKSKPLPSRDLIINIEMMETCTHFSDIVLILEEVMGFGRLKDCICFYTKAGYESYE